MPQKSALLLLLATAVAGCFVDAVGQPAPSGGSSAGGADPGGGTSTNGGADPVGAGGAGEAGAPIGAGGAGGGESVCGDAIVSGDEQCEDGNTRATDGCEGCMFPLTVCGDSLLGPGESCDPAGPDCVDCVLTGGPCFEFPPLAQTSTNSNLGGGPPPFVTVSGLPGCPGANDNAPTRGFSFDSGPYPRGFMVELLDNGSGSNELDPLVFATQGCGGALLGCTWNFDFARFASPLLSPGTQVFLGIGDNQGGNGDYTLLVDFFRYSEDFATQGGWQTTGGWAHNVGLAELDDYDTSDEAASRITSPEIYVGGLSSVRVRFRYGFNSDGGGASLSLLTSVTGEAGLALQTDLPQASLGPGVSTSVDVELNGSSKLWLGFEFDNPPGEDGQVWVGDVAVLEPL